MNCIEPFDEVHTVGLTFFVVLTGGQFEEWNLKCCHYVAVIATSPANTLQSPQSAYQHFHVHRMQRDDESELLSKTYCWNEFQHPSQAEFHQYKRWGHAMTAHLFRPQSLFVFGGFGGSHHRRLNDMLEIQFVGLNLSYLRQ